MRALDTRSRGDLIRLADQQQVLLAELVAARERDRAEIAELRAANVRLAVGVAELRAERETAQVTIAELRAANEQLRARVLELEGELAKLKKGGPRGMPGLKSDRRWGGRWRSHGRVGSAGSGGLGARRPGRWCTRQIAVRTAAAH